jgi:hypothetical protein
LPKSGRLFPRTASSSRMSVGTKMASGNSSRSQFPARSSRPAGSQPWDSVPQQCSV